MEKCENQVKFVNEFKSFIDSIELNENFDNFVDRFKKHKYFEYCAKTVEKLEKDSHYGKEGVKIFILCSFTRDRETCAAIVQMLQECNLTEQAKRLKEYNTSSGPIDLSDQVELKVAIKPSPVKLLSNAVALLNRPRGKCVIINNVEEPQSPPYYDHGQLMTPIGLKRETERFRHIFSQLYFDVKVLTKLSAIQVKEELTKISKDQSLKKDEAFVLIIISHGMNEEVLGYNACEALRKINFGQLDKIDKEAQEEIKNDRVPIKELVTIFSGSKDNYLNSKPKLHFYICCREKSDPENLEKKTKVEINENKPKNKEYVDTFVTYACAEGYEAYYNSQNGYTYFGQALSHSIAQYACEYHLGDIMTRTSQRLQHMYSKWESNSSASGCYAIQVNTYAMSFQLYFNPGHSENPRK